MCLLIIAREYLPEYPLIIAANRDEYYARPACPMHFWKEIPGILAGKDLQAGGTWLGVHRKGRFAAVTNFRTGIPPDPQAHSRGKLVVDFLQSNLSPADFVRESINPHNFNPFNLVAGSGSELYYYSNHNGELQALPPGINAISNGYLNAPEPKLEFCRQKVSHILTTVSSRKDIQNSLLHLLTDTREFEIEPDPTLPLSPEIQRKLSAVFIHTRFFGTRCSTVLILDDGGQLSVAERTYAGTGPEDFSFRSFFLQIDI